MAKYKINMKRIAAFIAAFVLCVLGYLPFCVPASAATIIEDDTTFSQYKRPFIPFDTFYVYTPIKMALQFPYARIPNVSIDKLGDMLGYDTITLYPLNMNVSWDRGILPSQTGKPTRVEATFHIGTSSSNQKYGIESNTILLTTMRSWNQYYRDVTCYLPAASYVSVSITVEVVIPVKSSDGLSYSFLKRTINYSVPKAGGFTQSMNYQCLPNATTLFKPLVDEFNINDARTFYISRCLIEFDFSVNNTGSWDAIKTFSLTLPYTNEQAPNVLEVSHNLFPKTEIKKIYVSTGIGDSNITAWAGNMLSGIWDFEIIPNITFGGIVGITVGLGLLFAFLKFFT